VLINIKIVQEYSDRYLKRNKREKMFTKLKQKLKEDDQSPTTNHLHHQQNQNGTPTTMKSDSASVTSSIGRRRKSERERNGSVASCESISTTQKQKQQKDDLLPELHQQQPQEKNVSSSSINNSNTSTSSSGSVSNNETSNTNTNKTTTINTAANPVPALVATTVVSNNNNSKSNEDYETNMKTQLKKLNETLLTQIDDLTNELSDKQSENESLRSEIEKLTANFAVAESDMTALKQKCANYELEMSEISKQNEKLVDAKNEMQIKNVELSEKVEMDKLIEQKRQDEEEKEQKQKVKEPAMGDWNQWDEDVEEIDPTQMLHDELNEKNKLIKNLQQRLSDMKKTLHKELKYHAFPNESNTNDNSHHHQIPTKKSPTPNEDMGADAIGAGLSFSPADSPTSTISDNEVSSKKQPSIPSTLSTHNTTTGNNKKIQGRKLQSMTHQSSSGGASASMPDFSLVEDVNFKYLKHVVIKFMTSKEYEALHLIKALSTLLHFSDTEEKFLRENLQYRLSWFGTRPKLN